MYVKLVDHNSKQVVNQVKKPVISCNWLEIVVSFGLLYILVCRLEAQ